MFTFTIPEDVDAELRRLAADRECDHRDAARLAIRFRADGDVADLVAIRDDPHPCAMAEILFALASSRRPWLNLVPMPTEAVIAFGNNFGSRRARGESYRLVAAALTAAEPPSAMTAARRAAGRFDIESVAFPEPDIRLPLRPGDYVVWRYDGTEARADLPAPSFAAIRTLHEVANQTWPSILSGYIQAAPFGELPLEDLLALLGHLPIPPDNPRWNHLAKSTPTYWYRLMQPWVCLGILHYAKDEPWATSTRRKVLVDLAFGVEDWVSDAALFALVTEAYHESEHRDEVRSLVRTRLDAAVAAQRLVSIEESLAQLMLVTPGCTADDRSVAQAALARSASQPRKRRRWWQRRR